MTEGESTFNSSDIIPVKCSICFFSIVYITSVLQTKLCHVEAVEVGSERVVKLPQQEQRQVRFWHSCRGLADCAV